MRPLPEDDVKIGMADPGRRNGYLDFARPRRRELDTCDLDRQPRPAEYRRCDLATRPGLPRLLVTCHIRQSSQHGNQ
jgi:hypothetical protein